MNDERTRAMLDALEKLEDHRRLTPREFGEALTMFVAMMIEDALEEHLKLNHPEQR